MDGTSYKCQRCGYTTTPMQERPKDNDAWRVCVLTVDGQFNGVTYHKWWPPADNDTPDAPRPSAGEV